MNFFFFGGGGGGTSLWNQALKIIAQLNKIEMCAHVNYKWLILMSKSTFFLGTLFL